MTANGFSDNVSKFSNPRGRVGFDMSGITPAPVSFPFGSHLIVP